MPAMVSPAPFDDGEPKFSMGDVKELAKNKIVWYISIVMLIGYGFYSSTAYFTPYLTEVMGVSVTDSGFLSAVRTYLLLLLTPLGGWIADRVFHSTSRWLTVGFLVLAALFGAVMILPSNISAAFASVFTLIPSAFVMMTYGLIASLIPEARIKKALTGTAVGIASTVGYLPDSFYSVMFGSWLDKHGAAGLPNQRRGGGDPAENEKFLPHHLLGRGCGLVLIHTRIRLLTSFRVRTSGLWQNAKNFLCYEYGFCMCSLTGS